MVEPIVLIWGAVVVVVSLFLLLFFEIIRSQKRRESEDMFGTEAFDMKKAHYQITDKESRTIEKIVRQSSFSNKDAVFNSSILFEEAVTRFYEFRKINQIREETLESVSTLRQKLGYTINEPFSILTSTRQLEPGVQVSFSLDKAANKEYSVIKSVDEKKWVVTYSGGWKQEGNVSLEGESLLMRWTRPEDAIYSGKVKVLKAGLDYFELSHLVNFEKLQLRRWVREQVLFPVRATLMDSSKLEGFLFDLSAGGILLGLPVAEILSPKIEIQFDLPGFGLENVKIEILRNLGKKNHSYPDLYLYTASFSGEFGRIQENVLQYIFEIHKKTKIPL